MYGVYGVLSMESLAGGGVSTQFGVGAIPGWLVSVDVRVTHVHKGVYSYSLTNMESSIDISFEHDHLIKSLRLS